MSEFDYTSFLKEFDYIAPLPGAANARKYVPADKKPEARIQQDDSRQINAEHIKPKDFSELPAKLRKTINDIRIQHGKEPLKEPLLIDSSVIEDIYGRREEFLYLMKNKFIKSLKVGMTGRKEERMECLKKQGWELVDIIETKDFSAGRLERIALSTAKMMGAKTGEEAYSHQFDGWTECWPIETYPIENLGQLFADFRRILEGMLSTSSLNTAKINAG